MSYAKALLVMSAFGCGTLLLATQSPTAVLGQQPQAAPQPGAAPVANPFGQRELLIQPGVFDFNQNHNLFSTDFHGPRAEELELARQCDSLIKQLAKADGQEKDKIKTKITETIDKQFDMRQKRHESEISALETQLKKLKEMVQKRQENRKEIVGKRYEQLIRESEGLGW